MSTLLFEIGVEELPPSFIVPATEYLRSRIVEQMTAARIPPADVRIFSTCSRIALSLGGFPEVQPDVRQKVQGAPKKVAVTPEGKLTKAGEAFLRKYGVADYFFEPSADGKGDLITAWRTEPGRPSREIVVEILEDALSTIPFPKSMRWGEKDFLFARPIRWILCLIDNEPIERTFHGIAYAPTSFGHRFMAPDPIPVTFETYCSALKKAFVIADRGERRALIREEIQRIASEHNGSSHIDEELLDEVTDMTEWPVAVVGAIPPAYSILPPELISLVLKENQRYFTIYRADCHGILPYFIAVLNNEPSNPKVVIRGCEKVVAARLSDAAFYYRDDLQKDFASLTNKLSDMLFQKDLGSYRDKVDRVEKLSRFIGETYFKLSTKEVEMVTRAALLVKNDLLTGVVFEFPELQGTIGRYYARNAGFDEVIAQAIEEHYLPRFSGDRLPETVCGTILSLADKTDTIVGGFMAGMKPTGTKDKFAIRRNAISLLQIATECGVVLDLEEIFSFAARLIQAYNKKLALDMADIADFVKQRYYAVFPHDTPIVKSAIEADWRIPAEVRRRVLLIARLVEEKDILTMVQLYKRSRNILKGVPLHEGTSFDDKKLADPAERDLAKALYATQAAVAAAPDDLTAAHAIIALKPAIDRFFDEVLVMTDSSVLRNNRIALIRDIVTLVTDRIGDISWLGV